MNKNFIKIKSMDGLLKLRFMVITLVAVVFTSCNNKKYDPQPENTTMTVITADHPSIRYTGRIDFSNIEVPSYCFPGISILAKFQGSTIDIIIKDYGTGTDTTTNYYNIIIDGLVFKVLKVNATDTIYNAARGLSDADHTIEIFKRTESIVGKSSFKGFRLLSGKTLLSLPAAPIRKIEFIGDSYTCGYGDEVSINFPGGNPTTGFHSVRGEL